MLSEGTFILDSIWGQMLGDRLMWVAVFWIGVLGKRQGMLRARRTLFTDVGIPVRLRGSREEASTSRPVGGVGEFPVVAWSDVRLRCWGHVRISTGDTRVQRTLLTASTNLLLPESWAGACFVYRPDAVTAAAQCLTIGSSGTSRGASKCLTALDFRVCYTPVSTRRNCLGHVLGNLVGAGIDDRGEGWVFAGHSSGSDQGVVMMKRLGTCRARPRRRVYA